MDTADPAGAAVRAGDVIGLERLFSPRSVVVVGATERPGSYGAQTLLNLRRAGYAGRVVGVHPSRTSAFGFPCVPSLAAATEQWGTTPAAVVLAVPAAAVLEYVQQASALGCGGCIVYAAGFVDAARLLAAAGGMPVIGPNANGLVSVAGRVTLWGDAVSLPAEPGPIAVITQSGNVGVLALAHRGGLGLHSVISLGNAVMVDAAATLRWVASAGARSVALYLESDGDGARLASALAVCAAADVRVAVLKAGRSAAGRAATGAHTAALAGDHRVFAALVEEAGGVLARDPHQLFETARALAQARRDPGSVAVLTASGGDAAIAADLALDAGVPLAPLTAGTRARLAAALPAGVPVTNPLDHTNAVWADGAAIGALTEALAADPEVGHVVYVQDEPPGLPAADATEWATTRGGALIAHPNTLLVATTPGQEPAQEPAQEPGQEPGRELPGAISTLPALFTALTALRRPPPSPARLNDIAATAVAAPPTAPRTPIAPLTPTAPLAPATPRTPIAPLTPTAPLTAGAWLAEHEAKALLRGAGVPVVEGRVHALPVDARVVVASARELGFPVALKVSAPGLLHKSDAGLLVLGLRDDDEVAAAAHRLAPGRGSLLVERMVSPGPEVFVAATTDGVVPALVVGVGGVWAEVLDDVAVIPLPADADRVTAALHTLRARRLLGDLAPIADFAAKLGEVLVREQLSLIEVNPLIHGVAVDALARRRVPTYPE